MVAIRTRTMRLTETFLSLQGEGIHAGLPCFFIRTTGCDLRCRWCDTEYAFAGGQAVAVPEIVARIPAEINLVQITGGEPLLQEDGLCDLIEALQAAGKKILLETGGHRSVERVTSGVHIVLDIKLPGSRESDHGFELNLPFLKLTDEIKFVICDRTDYEAARSWVRDYALDRKAGLLFSPVFGEIRPELLAEWILADRLPVRMQLQQHKYIWDPGARGV